MDKKDNNDFDLDFDFEKEYGISPDFLLEPEFDEDALLSEFLTEDAPETEPDVSELPQEPVSPAPQDPEPIPDDITDDFLAGIQLDIPDEPLYAPEEPLFVPEESPAAPVEEPVVRQEPVQKPAVQQPQPAEEPEPAVPPLSRAEQRRIQRMKRRKFKEVYLPAILGGISLVLILIFVIGAITRGVANAKAEDEAAIKASQDAEDAAEALDREAAQLLAQAQELAAGYNYQAAIDMLDTFSGELTSYSELVSAKASYSQQLTQVQAWNDPSKITNLSFHVLIADPAQAFTDNAYATSFNKNFVTIDEFQKILEQLYANDYVLVDLDDIVTETVAEDGTITYSANTIYLPAGKTPIMITETMVNYFEYMIESGGFASRLVVDEKGDIKAEMVNSEGETVVGNYDLVPILEDFIDEHPDFSYQGARAILAVCGYQGVFGYRTMPSVKEDQGEDYYNEQVAGATKVVQALREKGYTIASYTYENIDYSSNTVAYVQSDMQKWSTEVLPILGDVDVMVFARGVDLSEYSGNKYDVLYSTGFRYFVGASTAPWAEVTNSYFHQKRLMVTGNQMAYASSTFSNYFNSMTILNDQRGTVPN